MASDQEDLLRRLNYRINNPSAWPEGFDQAASDMIREAADEIARLQSALTEKRRDRIGDSELAGSYLCRAEAAEAAIPPSGEPVAWRWSDDLAAAPWASTVLAAYFDQGAGEWIVQVFVAERPAAPFTHWIAIHQPNEAAPPAPVAIDEATHRHKKRGTDYVLIGIGKMQADDWFYVRGTHELVPVDMREVAIYRSVDDGSIWVRPREEFEDGRFEYLNPQPNGGA